MVVGRLSYILFGAYAYNFLEYSREIELVVKTASFRNLVNFKIVNVTRQQKLLSAVDTSIVEKLQRRDAFLLDKLSSYVIL